MKRYQMRMRILSCVFACWLCLSNIVGGQENLVINGNFEDPAVKVSQMFNSTSQGVVGWTIVSGRVDLNSTRWDSFHLDQSIDMAGVSPGTIEQTIKTNVGESYELTFVYANNPEIFNGQSVSGRLEVVGDDNVLYATEFTHTESEPDNMGYDPVRGCFVANSNESVLRIMAINSVGGSRGIVVDDVRIESYLRGDANLDGVVDLLDITVFLQIIQTGGYSIESDVNCDGVVDLLDVAPFVELLTGG